jgi:CRISPR system Cascade subunit CasB
VAETPYLIQHLMDLARREDRAALAALRRGLGKPPGTVPETFPHVTPYIPSSDNTPHREWPYYLVGSLFALHPETGAKGDLGWTCRQLGEHPSAEARFRTLLASNQDELPDRLRQIVSLARSAPRRTPIDWALLLKHLRYWTHPDGWVQRQWARSYWAPSSTESLATDTK